MSSDYTAKKGDGSLPPTNNGDVAHEGPMGVAEALVAVEALGVDPGQVGGVGLWGCTGNSGREGLRGWQAWRQGSGGGGGGGDGPAGAGRH